MRVEKERLSTQLESSKGAESATEANLASLRRQLAGARQEIASLADARDASNDRAGRSESESRARAAELGAAREALRGETVKREDAQRRFEEVRAELATALDDAAHLRARHEAQRAEYENQLALAHATCDNVQTLAQSSAEEAAAAHAASVNAFMGRMGSLEGELDATRHECATVAARLAGVTSDWDKARAEVAAFSAKCAGLELALAQAEAAHRADVEAQREADGARARLQGALEAAVDERDATHNRLTATAGEVSIMRGRLAELEALDALHREDEERIAALQARCGDMETLLAQSQAETEAAEHRVSQLREQSHVDLDLSNASTARVAAELQRVMRAREDDANASVAFADGARRQHAQLRDDIDASQHEAAQLRERTRALQAQLAQLAAEVQEARDSARRYHDDSMQAKADLQVGWEGGGHSPREVRHCGRHCGCNVLTPLPSAQAEVERAAVLHRATLEQLETIKADFYSFLVRWCGGTGSAHPHPTLRPTHPHCSPTPPHQGMFHPEEAAAAAASNGSLSAPPPSQRGARSPSSAAANAIVTTLTSDMDDLRRRLSALTSSARSAGVGSAAMRSSGALYRS